MLESRLHIQQNQRLEQNLSPQMIQSLQVLQLPVTELEVMIRSEIDSNPLLEYAEESLDGEEKEQLLDERGENSETSESATAEESVDWDDFQDRFSEGKREEESGGDREARIPYSEDFHEILLTQLHELPLVPSVMAIAEYLVRNLDDDGWFRTPLEGETEYQKGEVSEESEWMVEANRWMDRLIDEENLSSDLRAAIEAVQSLDPAGIGGRDLRECLLIQAKKQENLHPLVCSVLRDDFSLLERRAVSELSKKYAVSSAEIQKVLDEIGHFNSRPGVLIGTEFPLAAIPDVIVSWREGKAFVSLNDGSLPPLRLHSEYVDLMKTPSGMSSEEREYLREKQQSASWLIRAIEQRKRTILKVVHAIVRRQTPFFRDGPHHLKPMVLQEIADDIGMHVSTVNRVTNGRYVQTDDGIFDLKELFTSGVVQEDGSSESSSVIRGQMKALIDGEDSTAPLSDQSLADHLGEMGVQIARRTVAKYREQLGIPSARLRKRYERGNGG